MRCAVRTMFATVVLTSYLRDSTLSVFYLISSLVFVSGISEVLAADPGVDAVSTDTYVWHKPDWLPSPPVPEDNPMSEVKVLLGRHLFYDHRLSLDSSVACSTCHVQSLGFSDGLAHSLGIDDTPTHRNALTLANVGYSPILTWANPHLHSLELQSLVPLFGEEPREMGNNGMEQALFARLSKDAMYIQLFYQAFPEHNGAINLATIPRALAAFQRTLISASSPYDRYKYEGDRGAVDESVLRGEELFFSETAECYHCHQGFNFTDTIQTSVSGFAETAFHNTGLYNLAGSGHYPPRGHGLYEFSGKAEDMGRFRTQSLRNIAVSAPYFHDGSAATLQEVLDHYAQGGRTVDGPHAGVGRDNPYKDSLIRGFSLSEQQQTDLEAFLRSLTDEDFLTNPEFANPWPAGHSANGRASQP